MQSFFFADVLHIKLYGKRKVLGTRSSVGSFSAAKIYNTPIYFIVHVGSTQLHADYTHERGLGDEVDAEPSTLGD